MSKALVVGGNGGIGLSLIVDTAGDASKKCAALIAEICEQGNSH